MLIALIIVAVVAAILAVMFWLTRTSSAEFRAQADHRESVLVSERDQLTETKAGLERELAAAQREKEHLSEHANQAAGEVRRLGGELDKARDVGEQQASRLERQADEIGALVTDNSALQARVQAAETAAAAVIARDSGIVIGELDDIGSQPETLWNLEVSRSERTWRNSVAINPAADRSPFEETDDPLRLAVEIEAAALRENVGAFITIDWRAEPVADAARRHLIVRVAQELLEAAARSPEPSRLVAFGDDEVTLRLEAIEDSDEVINVIPPRITSDLLDVRDEAGLSITVKAD